MIPNLPAVQAEQPAHNIPDDATLYEVLGLRMFATDKEIKAAYRRLVKVYHPDNATTGNAGVFLRITEAYLLLIDPVKRKAYDVDNTVDSVWMNRVTEKMHSLILALFNSILDSPTADLNGSNIVAYMTGRLGEALINQTEKLTQTKRRIKKLRKFNNRILRKDSSEANMFADALMDKIEVMLNDKEIIELEIQALSFGLEELSHYESIVETMRTADRFHEHAMKSNTLWAEPEEP